MFAIQSHKTLIPEFVQKKLKERNTWNSTTLVLSRMDKAFGSLLALFIAMSSVRLTIPELYIFVLS